MSGLRATVSDVSRKKGEAERRTIQVRTGISQVESLRECVTTEPATAAYLPEVADIIESVFGFGVLFDFRSRIGAHSMLG